MKTLPALSPPLTAQIRSDAAIPNITYDLRLRRYRYQDTGKLVSAQAVEHLTRQHIAAVQGEISQIGDRLLARQITLKEWQQLTREKLKSLHVGQMLLARGGQAHATSEDYLQVARTVKAEYGYFRQFAIDVQRGYSIGKDSSQILMTEARFRARLKDYAASGLKSFHDGVETNHRLMGYVWEQRLLGAAVHCRECVIYAGMGIQPIGTLPNPMERCSCHSKCKCRKRFYKGIERKIQALHGFNNFSQPF